MTEQELLKTILENLKTAATTQRAKVDSSSSRDCQEVCRDKYDKCMEGAGSDLEKAVCNSKYVMCVADC